MDLVAGLQISQFLIFLYRVFELGSVSPTWCPGFLQCCALGWHVIPRSMHFPQASGEKGVLVGGCCGFRAGCWAVVGGFGVVYALQSQVGDVSISS